MRPNAWQMNFKRVNPQLAGISPIVYLYFSIFSIITVGEMRDIICAACHFLTYSPFCILRYGHRFFLCQTSEDGNHNLVSNIGCVNVLFLNEHCNPKSFQFSEIFKAVLCISCESADGLGVDSVNLSSSAVLHQPLELVTLIVTGTGDAFIGMDCMV